MRDAREQSAANLLDHPFARNRSSAVGRSTDMLYGHAICGVDHALAELR
jgi:hypothetical protein